VGEDRGSKETDGCPLTHERRRSGFSGIMLVPFINMVFDKPTGNAVRGKLSIGKYNLSLQILFTLLFSNIVCTYETLTIKWLD
jgi:hypothetical protein